MTKEECIVLVDKGMTLKEIGEKFGIKSPGIVKKWLDKYNLTTKKSVTMIKNRGFKLRSDYDWVAIQKYYDEGHMWKDVLYKFNIPNTFLYNAKNDGLFKTRSSGESLKILYKLDKIDVSQYKTDGHRKKCSEFMTKLHAEGNHPGWAHINSRKDRRSYPETMFLKYFKNTEIYNLYRIEEKLPIGKYFLDFAIIDLKLNIEIDGSQHYRNDAILHDTERNNFLNLNGWKVYRIKWSDFRINAKKEIEELISYIKDIQNKTDRFYKLEDIQIKTLCKICKNEIGKKSNLCRYCLSISNRKVVRPSKEELKQLLENTTWTQIGKMFKVSDNAVRKWAKQYDLIKNAFEAQLDEQLATNEKVG